MTHPNYDDDQEEIRNKIKWLMGLRILIVTVLMGGSILLNVNVGPVRRLWSLPLFYFMIAFTYFLTILYALVLGRLRRLELFAYVQIGVDIGLETLLVAATGGRVSPFTFLYLVSTISASMILYRRGGMATASAASILYGLAGDLQHYDLLAQPPDPVRPKESVYLFLVNVVALFTVALLSSNLAEKLRQARRNLREKETGLNALEVMHQNVVQSISSGLLTTDLAGRITSLNRAALQITGYDWEEVRGRRFDEAMAWPGLSGFFEDPLRMQSTGRYDVETRRKDGSRLLLGVTLSPLRDGQETVAGLVGTFQDVTKIRELEERVWKREKLAMVGEVAAGMAHEIRNPLAAVSGSLQVLSRDLSLGGDYQRLMQIALQEMDRLNHIVNEFLYYARPSPPQYKTCDLPQLLEETLYLIQAGQEQTLKVKIETAFDPAVRLVRLDPDQMRQVFWNLCTNAIQAMPEGGCLTIRTALRTSGGFAGPGAASWAEIGFRDEGVGIAPEHLGKVFDPFFTTKTNGSGLGLAIVQRIIEECGGQIEVQSRPGQGTCFTVWLPMEGEATRGEAGA